MVKRWLVLGLLGTFVVKVDKFNNEDAIIRWYFMRKWAIIVSSFCHYWSFSNRLCLDEQRWGWTTLVCIFENNSITAMWNIHTVNLRNLYYQQRPYMHNLMHLISHPMYSYLVQYTMDIRRELWHTFHLLVVGLQYRRCVHHILPDTSVYDKGLSWISLLSLFL